MLYFSRWKITLISMAILAGVIFAFPNLLSEKQREVLPEWMPALTLGLDLQGGSHLLMQVGREELAEARMESLQDDARASLREDRTIRFRFSRPEDNTLEIRLTDPEQTDQAKELLADILEPIAGGILGQTTITEVELEEPRQGVIRLILTSAGLTHTLQTAVSQSIEVIRNRIDELGTTEPVVQRQGADRILVQVPGLDDPQRLKDLIGQTAKLTFHLVDLENSVEDALDGRPPAGTKLLYEDTDPPTPYLIQTRVMVEGESLTDAQPGFDQRTNEPIVSFRFDTKGATRFGRVTTENVGRPFAIVLDDQIISAPVIREPILGGSGQISGDFTVEGANDLAVLLRAGALPAKLTFIEERSVGPSLGADSIAAGEIAGLIGAAAVLIFMLLAYGFLGIIANLALAANISMIIALLSSLGATLTLPGIAGIVLTVGMAVDANVLIFERIREDRRTGRNLIQAIDSGFRSAFGTILDANITTFIAASILFYLGSGPVRGFAITLAIGILTTVFTAYLFTRLLVALWVRYKKPKDLPKPIIKITRDDYTHLRFMWLRGVAFPASIIAIIASIGLFFTASLNYGIDFQGGTLIEVQSKVQTADIGELRDRLGELNLGDVQVQEFGSPRDVLIRVEAQGLGEEGEQSVINKVRLDLEEDYEFRRVEVVGPTVSGELARAGLIAVISALLAIMVYIWFRFEWQFALGAVIATLHDVLLTIGMFALLQLEFNLSTIAAVLTIVGYSLNDTVVVYDRIRENLRKFKKKPIPDLLDLSINQMLARTILTSITTLLALFSLYLFGGEVLKSFTFAMIFGVFVGTYSSIFIAAPILIFFNLRPGQLGSIEKDADKEKQATANTMPVDFD